MSIRVLDIPIIKYYYSGWPAISYVSCHKTKTLQSVYHYLQPHVEESKSYYRDSIDFIKKVPTNDKVPADVHSLYPQGLEAVEKTLIKNILSTVVIVQLHSCTVVFERNTHLSFDQRKTQIPRYIADNSEN